MNIIGISINHHTAPIEMREALHLSREEIISFIPRLREHLLIEGIVISTCNRTEIFGFPRKDTALPEELQDALFQFKKVDGISPGNFRNYFSCSAVRHLFRVASGLDSLV
ncbi:partial Glutamyl-tRNA reductase, partial [Candidatus Brocadiaceae bacterium]